ncbi:MAG: transposase [Clostridia bacterium]|nr:transposase [Clostridia bacterium]
MITKWKRENSRLLLEMVDIDRLVPKTSPLRRIDAAVDWEKIYEIAEPFYAQRSGRPATDPAVLIRLVLLSRWQRQKSASKTLRLAGDSISARWFLGYPLSEKLPSRAAVASALSDRFDKKTFSAMLAEAIRQVYLAGAMTKTALGLPAGKRFRGKTADPEALREAAGTAADAIVRSLKREFPSREAGKEKSALKRRKS